MALGKKDRRGRKRGLRVQGEHGCRTCQHPEHPRINFLIASGADKTAVAAQFGLPRSSILYHFDNHLTDRYKRLIGSFRLDSFEELLSQAAEGDAESLDILRLLIRGHVSQWGLALEAGSTRDMALHASRILQSTELRSRITRELTGTPTIQINNYLTHDAAQLVQVLEKYPEAAHAVVEWHQRRTNTRVIEYTDHVSAAD
jgi:hypothetical protein